MHFLDDLFISARQTKCSLIVFFFFFFFYSNEFKMECDSLATTHTVFYVGVFLWVVVVVSWGVFLGGCFLGPSLNLDCLVFAPSDSCSVGSCVVVWLPV